MACFTSGAPIAGMALLVATSAAAQQLSPKQVGSVRPEVIRFEPFAAFPTGAELAKVVGDPTRPGPYVVRVKVASGVMLLPHIHPEDRVYTVIWGVLYRLWDRFRRSQTEGLRAGKCCDTPRQHPSLSLRRLWRVHHAGDWIGAVRYRLC